MDNNRLLHKLIDERNAFVPNEEHIEAWDALDAFGSADEAIEGLKMEIEQLKRA